jgi:tRNA (guanine-N7-)-methyltransferase
LLIGNSQELNLKISDNTKNYPTDFKLNKDKAIIPEATHIIKNPLINKVNILDIGCGYGGLLFNLSSIIGKNDLALGLEIRDKVSNYVGERIKAIRNNSNGEECSNISIIKTNAMKVLLNYFYKGQIEKMFFCFADPHFKKYTHRRRIIK